jgi:hypothetical protein
MMMKMKEDDVSDVNANGNLRTVGASEMRWMAAAAISSCSST